MKVNNQNKPTDFLHQEPKQEEGYSTNQKVAIVGGAIVAVGLFWWCGGPAAVVTLGGKIWGASSTMSAAQIAAAQTAVTKAVGSAVLAGTAVEKGIETVLDGVEGSPKQTIELSKMCDEALQKADPKSPNYEADWLDHLISKVSGADLKKIPQQHSGPCQIPMGNDHVTIPFSKSSNPFETLGQVGKKLFSEENLRNAAKDVDNAQVGSRFDVEYYKPMIDRLYEQDSLKFKHLKDKLTELERAQSIKGKIEDLINENTQSGIAAVIGGVAGHLSTRAQDRINHQVDQTIQNPAIQKTKQEELDQKLMERIEKIDCEGILDLKAFKKLAEDTFSRHPHFVILHQSKYNQCLEKIKNNANLTD